ncbi:MAG TPA: hypothetical protein DIU15_15465 [Deltaproteobacteria bacterium]|nr:hypothetical protein [Deltaproteobacteria bacterium]HCP47439.1 hypothetical protein [Deltaproteobacteria bacterium]|tara:strand:+ start:342 stop:1145 length:804 start_codon:yes stop_codon:yes gene_type:complete
MGLFDVHAHLTHPRLLPQVDEVLDHARSAGLSSIISNGLNPEDNQSVRDLAARCPLVRPAFGLYPVDAVLTEMAQQGLGYPREPGDWTAEEAVEWVREHAHEAIAVGEIGLDGYWVPEDLWQRQEQIFRSLVQVALDADKPIIIHSRKREQRCFEIVQELGAKRVNFHCFGSKVKRARRYAGEGYYFSIPANARRSESFTRMLETLPRDRLLLETDCPYLSPERDTTNEPANVSGTLAYAAELWGETETSVLEQLEENYCRLFGSPP